jgi:hypothetical protein
VSATNRPVAELAPRLPATRTHAQSSTAPASLGLRGTWELRNAAAETLVKVEQQLRAQLATANATDIVGLLESFSMARSPGPEWTRSFDSLAEHLWAWCEPALLAEVEAVFRSRGPAWAPIANALVPEHGARLRRRLGQQSAPSRLPPFTLG